MPKLAILRGRPTAGKSTAYANLRKSKEMKDWEFVDHCAMKTKHGREGGKKELFKELRRVMPYGKNVVIEEMSKEGVMKNISKEIKKYNYEIIVFQFTVDTKTAYKRDVKRAEDGWHPFFGKEKINAFHKMHDERFDKGGILIDTNKLNKTQVLEKIIKELK